jgi:hypothetical protein
MTASMTNAVCPVAVFVVEREIGCGYRVTHSEGAEAGHLADSALAILDVLGQPDPRDPETVVRWLKPDEAFGHSVGVRVMRLSNGEVRYEQTWFAAAAKPRWSALWFIASLLLGGISGVVAGVMAERVRVANAPAPSPPVSLVESQRELRDIQAAVERADSQMGRLIDSLAMPLPHVSEVDGADIAAKTVVVMEKRATLSGDGPECVLHCALETFDAADASQVLALLRRLQEMQGGGKKAGGQSAGSSSESHAGDPPGTDRRPTE